MSLDRPDWYVLTLAGDAEDPDMRRVVSDGYVPSDRSLEMDADRRFVVCFVAPEEVGHAEWWKIRTFHERHGREGSPIFVGHPVELPMSSSPIWLDVEFARCATYIVQQFMFHALVRIK